MSTCSSSAETRTNVSARSGPLRANQVLLTSERTFVGQVGGSDSRTAMLDRPPPRAPGQQLIQPPIGNGKQGKALVHLIARAGP